MACQLKQPKRQPLLELPPEIRLRIYEFIFTSSKIYVVALDSKPQHRYLNIYGSDVGLLLTCRQIYQEAHSEWYTANLWTIGFPPALGYFLRSTSPGALARVRHLTIQIHELPDLNTKLLPGLKTLIIDFTMDLPSFMTGRWYECDDEKIYSRFADEAIARVHSTFRILITELHGESRLFNLCLFASACAKCDMYNVKRREIVVNLDTKLVQRRTINLPKVDEQDHCPKEESVYINDLDTQSNTPRRDVSVPEQPLEQTFYSIFRRHKFPPGREGPFGDEYKDERGSIRSLEQEDSPNNSDDDDDDDDEEAKRLRQAAARSVDWEDVKRIIEHPSEDEQSASGGESFEENVSEARHPELEADHQDEQSASGDESKDEDAEKDSAARHLQAEVNHQIGHLILRSRTASPEPEPEPVPEQQQPVSPCNSGETGSQSKIRVRATAAQVQVAGDQHGRVEERVMYTTGWPEEELASLSIPNLAPPPPLLKSEAVSQTTELEPTEPLEPPAIAAAQRLNEFECVAVVKGLL